MASPRTVRIGCGQNQDITVTREEKRREEKILNSFIREKIRGIRRPLGEERSWWFMRSMDIEEPQDIEFRYYVVSVGPAGGIAHRYAVNCPDGVFALRVVEQEGLLAEGIVAMCDERDRARDGDEILDWGNFTPP